MTTAAADTLVPVPAEPEGTVEHFTVLCAGEPGVFIVAFRDDMIGVVDSDFRPGVDAVLPFPKFNEPGSAPVIEIDGKRVENHLKTGRHIVVKPGVSGLSLGRVHRGGKESAVTMEIVTKRIYQLI